MSGTKVAFRLLVFVALGYLAYFFIFSDSKGAEHVTYDQIRGLVERGQVSSVVFESGQVRLYPKDTGKGWVAEGGGDPKLLEELLIEHKVAYKFVPSSGFLGLVISLLPFLLLLLFFLLVSRGPRKALSMMTHRSRRVTSDVTFQHVAGHEEVIRQMRDLVEYLRDPRRFTRLGAKAPRGTLLFGPPGTGKTLIAKALAGEVGVPFFGMTGSDFVEMFVGVGAARVRSLFQEARASGPAVLFIDEIDGIGRHRSSGAATGGHDEHAQTLNALLEQMDGFSTDDRVVVIAATNRPESLDPALLRPGRFDRKIAVPAPSRAAREQVLRIHASGIRLGSDVDLEKIASMTPGLVGADLSTLVNEAAVLAGRDGSDAVQMQHFVRALETLAVGDRDHGRRLSDQERNIVAVHETGHLIAATALGLGSGVARISIIPTSKGALGYNLLAPASQDSYLRTRSQVLAEVGMLLGGRAAEEVMLGEVSTGASDDLRRANELLHRAVMLYGLGERTFNRVFIDSSDFGWSDRAQEQIEDEVSHMLSLVYEWAKQVIQLNQEGVTRIVGHLLYKEELTDHELGPLLQNLRKLPLTGKPLSDS